jgi:hypothetical protein
MPLAPLSCSALPASLPPVSYLRTQSAGGFPLDICRRRLPHCRLPRCSTPSGPAFRQKRWRYSHATRVPCRWDRNSYALCARDSPGPGPPSIRTGGDAVLARPSLSLPPGSEGQIEVEGLGTIGLTPTVIEAERLSIAFHVTARERDIRPRLVLRGSAVGEISIDGASGTPLHISVAWQR